MERKKKEREKFNSIKTRNKIIMLNSIQSILMHYYFSIFELEPKSRIDMQLYEKIWSQIS